MLRIRLGGAERVRPGPHTQPSDQWSIIVERISARAARRPLRAFAAACFVVGGLAAGALVAPAGAAAADIPPSLCPPATHTAKTARFACNTAAPYQVEAKVCRVTCWWENGPIKSRGVPSVLDYTGTSLTVVDVSWEI